MRLYPVWNIHHSQPYDSLVDALLAVRSLDQADLNVGPEVMHDPASLCDMDSAVERIVQAIRQREKIVVFGDYDVDGVSAQLSCSTFWTPLEQMGRIYCPIATSMATG